jgi:peptidoglycan pentaglycine glycine transferase (the first glycine)
LNLDPTLSSQAADERWNRFVASHPYGHVLQTASWGDLKSGFGWSAERVALTTPSDGIVAGAQILYRPLPFGLGTLAYVPRGPVVDWADELQVARIIAAMDRAVRSRGAILLTLEPDLPDTAEHARRLAQAGFSAGVTPIQPRRTLLVDLTPDNESILGAMKSKTRYNIGLSARRGVTVRQGAATEIAEFNNLMAITGDRNEFGVRPPEYYRAAYQLFVQQDQVGLFLADFEGQPLAGVMVFGVGKTAWYFFGGSSDAHRNLMAPYAAQWAGMCWAKARGCRTYDLWGVPDADAETLESQFTERSDGLWGVYRFKRGFGGRLSRTVGAWDRVYSPLRYRLYRCALRWR